MVDTLAWQQLVHQLEQTEASPYKYADMLAKADGVTRLVLDERWQAAEVDKETCSRERAEDFECARLKREREAATRREAVETARRARACAQQAVAAIATVAVTTGIKSASHGHGSVAGSSVRERETRPSTTTGIPARGMERAMFRNTGTQVRLAVCGCVR